MIANGDLIGPGIILLLAIALVMAVLVVRRGLAMIRPAYVSVLSIAAGCALAAWGTHDLVNRQFGLIMVMMAAMLALFLVGIATIIARRRAAKVD